MMSSNSIVLGTILLLCFAAYGCHGEPGASADTTIVTQTFPQLTRKDGQEYLALKSGDVPGMTTAAVQEVALPGVLETTGQVTFDDRLVSTIVSRVQGRIEDIRVSLWDNVRKGEPIVEVYSPDYMLGESEYLQAQNTQKVSLHASVEGSADLANSMVTAAKRKLELLGMSDADIDAIKSPAINLWIRAPISGTVVQNQSIVGSAINPGDVLYQLGTLDHVWVTGDIYEVDLARVSVGQHLDAVTTSFPSEVFKGVIERVSPNIDLNAHTAEIRCEIQNPGLKLRPQMLARVKVITNVSSALVVPQMALVFDGDSYCAFVRTGSDTVERRQVEIGSWNDHGYARVLSGLKAGEIVIVRKALQVNALWHAAHGESS